MARPFVLRASGAGLSPGQLVLRLPKGALRSEASPYIRSIEPGDREKVGRGEKPPGALNRSALTSMLRSTTFGGAPPLLLPRPTAHVDPLGAA